MTKFGIENYYFPDAEWVEINRFVLEDALCGVKPVKLRFRRNYPSAIFEREIVPRTRR